MKLGDIGEEMVATAVALAKESGARIEAITVVQVPRERALDAELPPDVAERAAASLAEARALGEEQRRRGRTPTPSTRARSGTRSSTRPRGAAST